MVRIPRFHRGGRGSIPRLGNKILRADIKEMNKKNQQKHMEATAG